MKRLFLFTTNYPFDTRENFLEEEIKYLSSKFDRVIIVPFYNGDSPRRIVPDNCDVIKIPLSKNRIVYILLGIFHPSTAFLLIKEFFRSKVYLSKKRLFAWGSSARYLNNCLYNRKLRKIMRDMKPDDVCYSYWGIGQCLLSIVLKGKVKFVSRFHGEWDLWEESYGGFHSLRTDVAHSLDKAVFISKKGEEYFKTRYPYARTVVFPLGTKDYGEQKPRPNDSIIRIVSCSSVIPLKRVDFLFEALDELTDYSIEWTHIGAGRGFDNLKQAIRTKKNSNLTINLLGYMQNEEVLSYYKRNHFDCFVNLSTSEGVPVSIMEAESFGIPIVATDVGCTSEEVTKEVGELLSSNPTIQEITMAIKKVVNTKYEPRAFWLKHYNADKNYREFAEMLLNL